MLRIGRVALLKARPKGTPVDVGSNRTTSAETTEKMKDLFGVPAYPGKRAIHNWRFFIKPGKAATGPPVGQEFSKLGLKPMDFCKAFNDKTKPAFKDDIDLICRVQVFHDLSFSWRVEPPPTAWFILRAVQKKRRETGGVKEKGGWTGFITLEMCYEIAKYKQFNWGKFEYPPIEVRARSVASQARRMGIAVIGVDAPNSPVKGMTPAQYEKQAAVYRKEQWAQWEKVKADELAAAPLVDQLHQPDFMHLTEETLERAAKDSTVLASLYSATQPKSKYVKRAMDSQSAEDELRNEGALGLETKEDIAKFAYNWRRGGAVEPDDATPFWNRDAMRQGTAQS